MDALETSPPRRCSPATCIRWARSTSTARRADGAGGDLALHAPQAPPSGIHKDAAARRGRLRGGGHAEAGVTAGRVGIDHEARGTSGWCRPTASARAPGRPPTRCSWSTSRRSTSATARHHRHRDRHRQRGPRRVTSWSAPARSQVHVVLRFQGTATLAENVEIVVGDGAQLTVVSLQDWADDAVHHSTHHAMVGRDASLRHVAVSFGGDVVRHDATAEYAGPGGSVEMLGLYFADEGQHIEHRLFVDHNQPHTRSNVIYKGALQGQGAHAVWIGNVLIRKAGRGHRDLRGEPQPRAHRRLPGRLGAQPGDRDRRDPGCRPRLGDRPVRRQPAVLPALARDRGVRGPPPGGARLLQRPDPQDRRARARGAAGAHRGGGAGEERPHWRPDR